MQQTSSNYRTEIKQPSRFFECRVTIGKNVYTNTNIVDIILDYPQSQDGFRIGNTTSQSLDLTLFNTGEEIYSTNQIKVEIGLKIGDAIEYILMGYYNVDEVSKNDYTIKFTAFDNMMKFETPYFSSLGDKPTLQQVINELASITGVSFNGSVPNYTVTKLDGYTCREVLSYVASLCGGNAIITRDGKFTIKKLQNVDYSITTDNHFGITTEEVAYKVGKITCVIDSESELNKGGLGTDSMELGFENPWMTESILNTLYQQLNGFSYLGFQTKWQGDLSLDPYDSILIQDRKGTSYRVPILSQKFTYVGGLTSELGAKGESKNKNSFSSSGSNSNKVNRLVTEQAIIKEALINKANIQDLEAVSIRTQRLEATTAKIETAIIDVAYVSDLNVIRANISELKAMDATISQAVINKADISELNAAVANINILNADLATIKHLVAGNISSENIQTGGITSDKLTIANAFIKDAMIDSLNANKIKAGQINTALVRVTSSSGNLVINDNTIQIRDANRVRVQIGKDASNDYSMSVWDSSGKLMFDARGLKADAIKDSIIRNDMISTNANIDGSKLNINSVVSSINQGSSLLKASKVQIDGVAQTLEVAFNVLKTQADGTKSQTESNTTAINVAQGKINTLIQDTTITKDGQTVKLKDEYSKLEQTVGSLSSTIGKQQTTIDNHSGKITATNSEMVSLKQNMNGLSASVSSAQTTIQSHTQQLAQKADLTTVNEKIDAIPFVGRNMMLDSKQTSAFTSFTGGVNTTMFYRTVKLTSDLKVGDSITVSLIYKYKNIVLVSGQESNAKIYVQGSGNVTGWTSGGMFGSSPNIISLIEKGNTEELTYRQTYTFKLSDKHLTNETFRVGLRTDYIASGTLSVYEMKVEKGNKVTDWSPAPEDIDSALSTKANSSDVYVKTEVYTKAQTDAAIKIAKDEINLSVSGTYETKTNVETKISSSKTEAINNSKSYADTKKAEAISTASTDATNKVNSAKTELNTAINKKANSTDVYKKTETYTKTETDSKINIAKDSITQTVSSTYETKSESTTKYNTATAIAKAMNEGKVLYTDIAFRTGRNSVVMYNNTENGNVVVERITKPTDCPTTSTHCIRITHKGMASPNLGGFHQNIQSRANAVFIQKFVAKLPSGYTLNLASNSMGDGYSDKWLTSNKGTGKWETYIRRVICGSTGTFSSGGHVHVSGATPTTSAPLVWYLASCTCIDITDTDERVTDLTSRVSKAEQKITDSAIIQTVSQTINQAKTEAINSANSNTANQLKNYSTTSEMNSAIVQKANEITSTVEVTKTSGVELLPQSYKGMSTSGYSVYLGLQWYATEYGMYTSGKSWLISDFIAVDNSLPIVANAELDNNGERGLLYIGVEQYDWNKNEVAENAATIYFYSGTPEYKLYIDNVIVTGFHPNTRYIRLRVLTNWNDVSGFDNVYIRHISLKQLGNANQSTQISQLSDRITSTVNSINTIDGKVNNAQSQINQQANQIASKVDVNGVKSIIQQNPEDLRVGFNGMTDNLVVHERGFRTNAHDGSYSEFQYGQVTHYIAGANYKYHSLTHVETIVSQSQWCVIDGTYYVPERFRNKNFNVIATVSYVAFDRNVDDAYKNLNISVTDINPANCSYRLHCTPIGVNIGGRYTVNASKLEVVVTVIA